MYADKPSRASAGILCFSQRCLETVSPHGFKAYLQYTQIIARSGLLRCNERVPSLRCVSSVVRAFQDLTPLCCPTAEVIVLAQLTCWKCDAENKWEGRRRDHHNATRFRGAPRHGLALARALCDPCRLCGLLSSPRDAFRATWHRDTFRTGTITASGPILEPRPVSTDHLVAGRGFFESATRFGEEYLSSKSKKSIHLIATYLLFENTSNFFRTL